ncbi:YcaO-like family protein [Priestia koreensis]|uniref:YcaO-like family protein n=1 Tax=Priestia koreensis TaxID=284581 RepID=UPI001F5A849A|nr:YcaO-like family protein [Priestia koreensis]
MNFNHQQQFHIVRGLFQREPKTINVIPRHLKAGVGTSVSHSTKQALRAAYGEHIERSTFLCDSSYINKETIPAFNLLTGEQSLVSAEKILLYRGNKIKDRKTYADSCGAGFHYRSFNSIQSAFLEFFERQSLIFNWLTESGGTFVDVGKIQDFGVKEVVKNAYQYTDEIFCFNISLHKNVYVILTLAFGKHHFGIGLKASWDIHEAIKGSVEEMFHDFTPYYTKHHLEDDYNLKLNTDIEVGEIKNDPLFYSLHFHSTQTSESLRQNYQYLFLKSDRMDEGEFFRAGIVVDQKIFMQKLKEVSKDLKMELLCCFLKNTKIDKAKVVKVFSNQGYPHMNTTLFNPLDYEISKFSRTDQFPNAYQSIPFP